MAAHKATRLCPRGDPEPANPAAYHRFDDLALPKPPDYNEADVSDKPPAVSGQPLVDAGAEAAITRHLRCTAAAMRSVDNGVGNVMGELRRTGQLAHTIVIYTSDNGFFFGEHRLSRGKSLPYEPALQVPYAVRVPRAYRRGPARPTVNAPVSNTDIAPTLLDYAGGTKPCNARGKCRIIDGRSIRPLLRGRGSFPAGRGVLAEIATDEVHYEAIRTRDRLYVEYADGFRELYDLKSDPFELANLSGNPSWAIPEANLAARLAALEHCSGTTGALGCE